mmetsp:Transcript_38373/g.65330  ORF Transcript_38373/g.65330 Transcript_38373/m.65330 type:complete len:248 (-) Transcript_38373:27-770(-)
MVGAGVGIGVGDGVLVLVAAAVLWVGQRVQAHEEVGALQQRYVRAFVGHPGLPDPQVGLVALLELSGRRGRLDDLLPHGLQGDDARVHGGSGEVQREGRLGWRVAAAHEHHDQLARVLLHHFHCSVRFKGLGQALHHPRPHQLVASNTVGFAKVARREEPVRLHVGVGWVSFQRFHAGAGEAVPPAQTLGAPAGPVAQVAEANQTRLDDVWAVRVGFQRGAQSGPHPELDEPVFQLLGARRQVARRP